VATPRLEWLISNSNSSSSSNSRTIITSRQPGINLRLLSSPTLISTHTRTRTSTLPHILLRLRITSRTILSILTRVRIHTTPRLNRSRTSISTSTSSTAAIRSPPHTLCIPSTTSSPWGNSQEPMSLPHPQMPMTRVWLKL
jgi:hypothetical protein